MESRINREVSPAVANEIWTGVFVLMGLRYPNALIRQILKGVQGMKESSTYRLIFNEGRASGRVEGRKEGRVEEVKNLLTLLGQKRFGDMTPQIEARLAAIDSLKQLEALSIRLLEVESWDELFSISG